VAPIPPYFPWDGFMLTDECTMYCNRESGSLILRPTWVFKAVNIITYPAFWGGNKHQPSHRDSADAGRHTKTAACGDKWQKQCCDGTAERKPINNQQIGLNRYTKRTLLINTRLVKKTTQH